MNTGGGINLKEDRFYRIDDVRYTLQMSITLDLSVDIEHRTVGSTAYFLIYDARPTGRQNRLIGVEGGGPTVTFTYDGDGNRVKKDEDGVITHYPGRHYESTIGSGSTKYYYADGQLAAFERSAEYGNYYGLRYVFRDHPSISLRTCLGSTSVIVNGAGVKLWEDRYLPGACPERRPEVVSRRGVRHTERKDDVYACPFHCCDNGAPDMQSPRFAMTP